jgi:nucleotide-binding universal stress UspA family protein
MAPTCAFRHILVATDFQPSAARALELAVPMAARDGAQLTLLNVYSAPVLVHSADDAIVLESLPELRAHAQRELDKLLAQVRGRWPRVSGAIREGEAKKEIVEAARELGADLVVLGTHGNSGLARVLLGSVAEHVVRHSDVPVLTVRVESPAP